MNPNPSNDIESLLRQMHLRKPSANLDQTVAEMAACEGLAQNETPGKTGQRFGWSALVSTAVAAMVGGLLLGQLVSLSPCLLYTSPSPRD